MYYNSMEEWVKMNDKKPSRVELNIYGRVQGVWFRYETMEVANSLGIKGFVENMPDGSVHVIAEGEREKLEKLIDFCRKGPPLARVDKVDISWRESTGEFISFSIRR